MEIINIWPEGRLRLAVLYLCAGLFWNLDWRPGGEVTFAFMEESCPSHSGAAQFTRVAWPALLLMLMVNLFITAFLLR